MAAFNARTGVTGKTIAFNDGAFVVENHRPISARRVECDFPRHTPWSIDWVGAWGTPGVHVRST